MYFYSATLYCLFNILACPSPLLYHSSPRLPLWASPPLKSLPLPASHVSPPLSWPPASAAACCPLEARRPPSHSPKQCQLCSKQTNTTECPCWEFSPLSFTHSLVAGSKRQRNVQIADTQGCEQFCRIKLAHWDIYMRHRYWGLYIWKYGAYIFTGHDTVPD